MKRKSDAPLTRDEALVPREETLPQPAADAPRAPEASEARPRRRWLAWVVGIGAAVLVAILFSVRAGQQKKARAVAAKKEAASRPIPVTGVAAKTGDLGVYISGLGTVTAINTVTVRSRVDGQLIRVAFREGQVVHEGDLLAEIDPRPFQVQLMQAEGQRGKDEATLPVSVSSSGGYRYHPEVGNCEGCHPRRGGPFKPDVPLAVLCGKCHKPRDAGKYVHGPVATGAWHELRADMVGDHIEVYFNGTKVTDAHDARFPGPGKVGVWTKADSRTLFDDLTATPLAR